MIALRPEAPAARTTEPQPAVPGTDRIAELVRTVSASRLNLFHACRLRFLFRHVARIAKPLPPALFVGRAVHALLQAWSVARWRGLPHGAEALRPAFDDLWAAGAQEEPAAWETPDEERSAKDGAWRLAETYLQQTPVPPGEKPVAVEVRAEADLGHHGLPVLVGVIDLVRPGGRIVDFKTTASTPNPERSLHANGVQLACYGTLFRDATGTAEGGFELHHLVKLKSPRLVVVSAGPMTDVQQSRLFRLVESYVDGVERRDFVPSPGLQCAACEFFAECGKWEGGAA